MKNAFELIQKIMASDKFFWLMLGLFLFQALWLVFSALYPMAFDEAYHFTFIQLYSQQWSPFIAEHPEGFDHLGVITRETSYLYHYLMSFPYRLIALFTANETTQILLLRLINVGFFTAALLFIRMVLLKAGLSRPLSNVSILLFTLIPIVPLLAAHINYDNLLILIVAWMFVLVQRIITTLRTGKLPVMNLLLLAVAISFTTVIKQASLPILLSITLFTTYYVWRTFRKQKIKFLPALKKGWRANSAHTMIVMILLLLVGSGLFVERYGLNLVRYQSLMPDCDRVLTVEQCMEFGPWGRNYRYIEARNPGFTPRLSEQMPRWIGGMWYRTFFMINGDVPVDRYQNFPPLPLPSLTALVIFLVGVLAAARYSRELFRSNPFLTFLSATAGFYILVLWYINFQSYSELGRTAAINGRYLLLVTAPLLAIAGLGLAKLLDRRNRLKAILAVLAIALFLQGGGVISFIVRSQDSWYWPHPGVQQVNRTAQDVLQPLIPGSRENYLRWVPR